MPTKGKNDNYDAIGGIIDFILAESEKPPEKRRPVKPPTGVSASSALTDAIFASLEKPGVFISNTLIDEFNSALDVKIAQVDFFGGRGNLKLTTNNLGGWLRDPGGQIQKAMNNAKADRKAARARMIGESIDDFLTTAWAHKYGDLESKKIALANASANEKAEAYKISRAVGQSVASSLSRDFIDNRTVESLGRKTFGNRWFTMDEQEKLKFSSKLGAESNRKEIESSVDRDFMANRTVELLGQKTFGNRWFTMNEQEKLEFSSKLGAKSNRKEIESYLARRYGRTEAENFDHLLKKKGYEDKIDVFDPDLYRELENNYLTEKIYSLKDAPAGSEGEKQRKIYEKTKMLINLKTKHEIGILKDRLKKGNLSDDEKREIERAINDAEIVLREIGGVHSLSAEVGRWEGYLNSIKMLGGPTGTNVVGSILNGDFFNADKNKLTPVKKVPLEKMPGVEIYVAKKDRNKVQNAYNEMGEALYYATPRSLFRTFFYNGELFARGLYKNNEQLKELLDGLGATGVLGKAIGADNVIDSIYSLDGKELNEYISKTLERIQTQLASGTLSIKDFEKIEKLLKQSKNLKNLTKIFSFPARTKKMIEDKIKGVFDVPLKKARQRIYDAIMKNEALRNWITKTLGESMLKEFVAKGGLRNLIKPLVSAVAGALGIALTPLASIAITIGVNIAMDLAGKIAKVFVQIMLVAIVGLIAGIVVLGGSVGSWKKWNRKTYSYNYVVPDTVNQCSAYGNQGYYIPPNGGGGGSPGPIIPPGWEGADDLYELYKRAREYVSETYGRSIYVELALVVCPGGPGCESINGAWCYSGLDYVYCKVDKLLGASNRYAYLLFVHELIHQIQGDSCPSMVREWGADYLSEGAGGYGCRVSTSACTPEEAVNAALCWDTSTACYRDVAAQVNGGACE